MSSKYSEKLVSVYGDAFSAFPSEYDTKKKAAIIDDALWLSGLARDVAMEILLGGFRLDEEDFAMALGRVTRLELKLFENCMRYHAVDFGYMPEGGNAKVFFEKELDVWTTKVQFSEDCSVRDAFRFLKSLEDRGKWFKVQDGFRKCTEDSVISMVSFGRDVLDAGGEVERVSLFDVLRSKADAIISKYGKEVLLDNYWMQVELKDSSAPSDTHTFVRRSVNTFAKGLDDYIFYVEYRTPSGRSSTLMSRLEPEEMERMISLIDDEMSSRQTVSKAAGKLDIASGSEGLEPVEQGGCLRFDNGPVISVLDDGGERLVRVSEIWSMPFGGPWITGSPVDAKGNMQFDENGKMVSFDFPLSSLSDKAVDTIRQATDKFLKLTVRDSLKQSDSKSVKSRKGSSQAL